MVCVEDSIGGRNIPSWSSPWSRWRHTVQTTDRIRRKIKSTQMIDSREQAQSPYSVLGPRTFNSWYSITISFRLCLYCAVYGMMFCVACAVLCCIGVTSQHTDTRPHPHPQIHRYSAFASLAPNLLFVFFFLLIFHFS
jgi:hypothetical protein